MINLKVEPTLIVEKFHLMQIHTETVILSDLNFVSGREKSLGPGLE